MRSLQVVPLLARGPRPEAGQATRPQRPQRVVDLFGSGLVRPLRGARENRQNTADTRRVRQHQQHHRRDGEHDEATEPALGQTGHPHCSQRANGHDHRGAHISAQHDRAERRQDRRADGQTHRLPIAALRRRLRDHESQEHDERKLEELGGLGHDRTHLHPVRITALRASQWAENQGLEAERAHEHDGGQVHQPPLRHEEDNRRNHKRREDDDQRASVGRIGVLPLRDRGHGLRREAHDESEHRQQQSRHDDEVVRHRRIILAFLPRPESDARQRDRRDVPAALIRRHRRSPTGPPDATRHRQTRRRAGRSYRTDPMTRRPERAQRCRPAWTVPRPR